METKEKRVVEFSHHMDKTECHESSIIEEVWYSQQAQELYIKLRTMDTVIGYGHVSYYVFNTFQNSNSLGSYYNYIKNNFPGVDGNVELIHYAEAFSRRATAALYREPDKFTFTVVSEVEASSVEEVEEMFGAGIIKRVTKHY